MEKIPKILLSILVTSVMINPVFSEKTQALYIDEDDATWYTITELLDYQKKVEQTKQDLCGDDVGCRDDWFFDNFENDKKLQALDMLEQNQFIVTAVNPKTETFKVLLFSENMMLKRWGISEKVTIDKFYLAWFENRDAQGYIGNFGAYEDELLNNTLPGTHTIFAYKKDQTRLEFPPVTDTEVELQMLPNSNLVADPIGSLGYLIEGEGYGATGGVHYHTCLNAPDYNEGEECRIMISAEKGVSYFPPRETILTTEENEHEVNQGNNQEDDRGDNQENNQEDNQGIGQENNQEDDQGNSQENRQGHADESDQEETPNDSQISALASVAPKTPNTGSSSEQNQTIVEFPWWLGAILAINFLTLLWLFLPLGLSKPKNRQKKS